jgi:Protein of unknown function (DUF2283)
MIDAAYDRHADVLYIALGRPRPDYGEEGEEGIIRRLAEADEAPCGVTVLGFRDLWTGREGHLAGRIGAFLRIDAARVAQAVEIAVSQEAAV